MAERFKAAVLKTADREVRGFESLSLRQLGARDRRQSGPSCEWYRGRLVEDTVDSISAQIHSVKQAFEERFGPYPALQRVETVVRKQCRRALQT